MKKPFEFNGLSEVTCKCTAKIKKNVLARKPNARLCYNCYRIKEELEGNVISTAREVRTGKRKGSIKGKYVN